ncbi:MAG: sugar phosphate nucleotidyltransferase, partial [Patescibacteria group bacterium]|nr:sugar phosphate nucleotidyltransferase [Patescibacteria group bacterium]
MIVDSHSVYIRPGFQPQKDWAVFFDRDGVINVEKQFVFKIQDFMLIPAAVQAIKKLNQQHIPVLVVHNAAVVARNLCQLEQVDAFNQHLINLCSFHNLKDIIISTHYLPEKIYAYFQDGEKFNVHLTYSHEKNMLGAAGALQLASALLKDDDFIVLNGDVMANVNLTEMISFHHRQQGLATFLVHKTDHPFDSDLVEYDDNFKILRFFRPTAGDNYQPISKTGTHIFKPSVLNFIPTQQ